MKKITLEMVEYWLGTDTNEGAKVIREIANSRFTPDEWTPKILYNDIIETWEEKEHATHRRNNTKHEDRICKTSISHRSVF
jgi:pyridoxine/pyridoxamine 5'-phosphate oxidase